MQVKQPTKQKVRDYLTGRATATTPPPNPADVRRQLGWLLTTPSTSIHTTEHDDTTR